MICTSFLTFQIEFRYIWIKKRNISSRYCKNKNKLCSIYHKNLILLYLPNFFIFRSYLTASLPFLENPFTKPMGKNTNIQYIAMVNIQLLLSHTKCPAVKLKFSHKLLKSNIAERLFLNLKLSGCTEKNATVFRNRYLSLISHGNVYYLKDIFQTTA